MGDLLREGAQTHPSYELFRLSDLPNGFVSAQDLEAILVNLFDRSSLQRFECLPDYRVAAYAVGRTLSRLIPQRSDIP